jgi:Tol biopolymer transport system component
VAFVSSAANLVSADTNQTVDVFVRDRRTGRTSRVSVSSTGAQANGGSYNPSISADGRYVAFESAATNLVSADTNGDFDVFIRDRHTGRTSRVSRSTAGAQANGGSTGGAVSADGRYVAFASDATNLTPADTNGLTDAFVRDLRRGTTTLVSVSGAGVQGDHGSGGAQISADGRYVTFWSYASNLVTDDGNVFSDVFLRDRLTGRTTLVSRALAGAAADEYSSSATISASGRYVAFWSFASNLVAGDTNNGGDIFLWDRLTQQTTRISVSNTGAQANDGSHRVAINATGRYIAFTSSASNLVPGDTNDVGDVFIRDRIASTTTRVSVSSTGTQANADSASNPIAISPGGHHVGFSSEASNLVRRDTNNADDAFLHSTTPR